MAHIAPPTKKAALGGRLGSLKKHLGKAAAPKDGPSPAKSEPAPTTKKAKDAKPAKGKNDSRKNLVFVVLLLLVFLFVVWFYVVPAVFPRQATTSPNSPAPSAEASAADKKPAASPAAKPVAKAEKAAANETVDTTKQEIPPATSDEARGDEAKAPAASVSAASQPSSADSNTPQSSAGASEQSQTANTTSAPQASSLLGRALEAAKSAAAETSALLGAGEDKAKKKVEVEEKPAEPVAAPQWPKIEVYAVIIQGNGGTALVNGSVLSIGEATPEGAVLRAVAPQRATLEWNGERRVFYTVAPPKPEPEEKQQAKKGFWNKKRGK